MPQKPLFSLRWRRVALATVLMTSGACAFAQWQWVDASGRKVFSDTAPPENVPDKNIVKRPGGAPSVAPVAPAAPATQSGTAEKPATASAPQLPMVDKELEAKKKQAEQAEEAKKKTEEQRLAQARTENCARARKAKVAMDSGIRITTTNAKGEREFMDDKTRASESRRLDEIVRSDCGPLPKPALQ